MCIVVDMKLFTV